MTAPGVLVLTRPGPAASQQLPFVVPIVEWDRAVRDALERTYRTDGTDRETLICVEKWTTRPPEKGVQIIVISRIRFERAGGAHRIGDIGALCQDEHGNDVPTIHTHSDGNCQFSPADLVSTVARRAAFEGVQCGPHYYIWNFYWHLLAIASAAERDSSSKPRPP